MLKKIKSYLSGMTKPSKDSIESIKSNLNDRVLSFKQDRDEEDQQRLVEDFENVLRSWGMTRKDIPQVLKSLHLRLIIFNTPLLIAAIVATQGGVMFSLFAIVPCFLVSVMGIATTFWRIVILKNERFIPFRYWLLSLLK